MEIWLAPPAGGKTKRVIDTIQTTISGHDVKKIWVLVPDQRQARSFRQQLLKQGGMLGVHVGGMDAFCKEILFSLKRYLPLLRPALRHRIVGEAVREMQQRGDLVEFLPIVHFPGFQGLLHRVFDEFCQAGLSGDEAQVGDLCCENAALKELIQIYDCYLEIVDRIRWLDPQGLTAYTAKVLNKTEAASWQFPDLILLDGFDRFTNPQIDLLQKLDSLGIPLVITLTADVDEARLVNRRFLRTKTKLLDAFPHAQVSWVQQESVLPSDLASIVREVFKGSSKVVPGVSSLNMLAVQSPLEEVREGLRWVKQKIVLEGRAPSSLAVIIPDESPYVPLLKSTALEFSLPLSFSVPEFLIEHPAVQSLLGLLTIRSQDFLRRPFLDLIRSPYLDFSSTFDLTRLDASALEMVSRSGPVVGGLENWLAVLASLSTDEIGFESPEALAEDHETRYALPRGVQAIRLRDGIARLAESLITPPGEQSLSAWISWLVTVLEMVNWQQCLETFAETSIIDFMQQVFQGLRLGELKLGGWEINYDQFLSILEGAFGVVCVPPAQPGQEGVQVLRMIEARGVRFSDIVMMGLSEGGFPKPTRQDPFLPDELREMFGLETRLEQDQASVFFLALTRADHHVLVTRPYLAKNGEALDPSPYWEALLENAGESVLQQLRPGERRSLSDAASRQELLFWGWQFYQGLAQHEQFAQDAVRLGVQRLLLSERSRGIKTSLYDGKLPVLPQRLLPLVNGEGVWSPSRLEAYRTCGMRFWVQSALNLEEQTVPEPGLQVNQIGSLLHKILELVYSAVEDSADVEAVLAALPAVAQDVFEQAPQEFGFIPTALWGVMQKEWLEKMEAAIVGLAQEGWKPLAQEQKFGLGGIAPLIIEVDAERRILVRGIIDRLDRREDGAIRVVDYKTGSGHLTKEDLINGTRLQLPLYAVAASFILRVPYPQEGFYWALLAEKAGSLQLSKFEFNDLEGPQGAHQVLLDHLKIILAGMEDADFHPQVPPGGCPSYCPARLWCWQYKAERRA